MKRNQKMNVYLNSKIAGEYDSFYKTNQGIAVDNIERQIITSLVKNVPIGPLLELGCGTEHWTQFFCEQGFQVTAIDASAEMLKFARNKNVENATFQEADAAELPFPDQSFSVIASITMLEFVDNVESVLKEIDRLLILGGHLLLGCLNAESELGKSKDNDDAFRHARFLTSEKIKKMLLRFGKAKLRSGVYYSPTFKLIDITVNKNKVKPAFIGAIVQKK